MCIRRWGVLSWEDFYFFFLLPSPSKSMPGLTKIRQGNSNAYCVALNEVFYFDWSLEFSMFSSTSSSATKSFVDS